MANLILDDYKHQHTKYEIHFDYDFKSKQEHMIINCLDHQVKDFLTEAKKMNATNIDIQLRLESE